MKNHTKLLSLCLIIAMHSCLYAQYTVAFWGDSRANSGNATEEISGYLLANKGKNHSVTWQNGDFTGNGEQDDWEKRWKIPNVTEMAQKDYYYMCSSNHDNEEGPYNANMGNILPSNGKNVNYYHVSWDIPNSERKVHLFSCDLGYIGSNVSEQTEYFEPIIKDQTKPEDWIALLYHAPTWTDLTYKGTNGRAVEFVEFFMDQNAGVDLVLNGHAHQYRRTDLLGRDGKTVQAFGGVDASEETKEETNGIMHIVNGRGGVFSGSSTGEDWSGQAFAPTLSENEGLITFLEFDDNVLNLRTIRIDDNYEEKNELDKFTWTRGDPMPVVVSVDNTILDNSAFSVWTNPLTGDLEIESFVSGDITIHNLKGNIVKTMAINQGQKLIWNGSGGNGQKLSAGQYIVRINTNGQYLQALATLMN